MLLAGRRPGILLPLLLAITFVFALVYLSDSFPTVYHVAIDQPQELQTSLATHDEQPSNQLFRLLLPATNKEVNLCKTLLTLSVLDYPTPELISWQQTFDNTGKSHRGGLLGAGSHIAKITGVLEYLNFLDSSHDNELVLMVDAYDIWFQVRPEVLVTRYHAINDAANDRLHQRLGRAVEVENLRQTIIFGAGKRCAPNQVHTVACYPVPESPLPKDLYGANTDTIMGRNKYTSLRQRYLNSGFIMGPAKDLRRMFQRAQEEVEASEPHPEIDNGSNGADFMYHGSDQSIFNILLGKQEFQREVMRLRHRSEAEKSNGITPDPPPTWIEGTLIDNRLDPSFTHERIEAKDGRPDELGIGLDYFSELGQQTVNSEEDAKWIVYGKDIDEQLEGRHGLFDCPSRVTGSLPNDLLESKGPFSALDDGSGLAKSSWYDVPLYTNVCLDTIPVMVHHNGNKDARQFAWPNLWIQPYAHKMLNGVLASREAKSAHLDRAGTLPIVAKTQDQALTWDELCPSDMDQELFRGG